jgi:hypothetical protein
MLNTRQIVCGGRVSYHAFYHMNVATEKRRKSIIQKVSAAMSAI